MLHQASYQASSMQHAQYDCIRYLRCSQVDELVIESPSTPLHISPSSRLIKHILVHTVTAAQDERIHTSADYERRTGPKGFRTSDTSDIKASCGSTVKDCVPCRATPVYPCEFSTQQEGTGSQIAEGRRKSFE